jgi:hypothetical protein
VGHAELNDRMLEEGEVINETTSERIREEEEEK